MEFAKIGDTVNIFINEVALFINFKKYFIMNADVKSIIFHLEHDNENIEDAIDIIDYIKANKLKTTCFLNGYNSSFAMMIAAACDKKYIASNADCYIASPVVIASGKQNLKAIEAFVKKLEGQTERMKQLLDVEWDKNYTAKELVALKIIDEIKVVSDRVDDDDNLSMYS